MNTLRRGRVTVSDENANFPKAGLYDGDPGTAFQHTSLSSTYVEVDGDLTLGTGSFEAAFVAGVPPGPWEWLNLGGVLVRDAVIFAPDGGIASCKIQPGAVLRGRFLCQADEILTLSAWLRGEISMSVQDIDTGQFLHPTKNWVDNFQVIAVHAGDEWTLASIPVPITGLGHWAEPVRRLYIEFAPGATSGWVDGFSFFPHIDTLGIFGNNLRLNNPVLWQSNDNPVTDPWTTRATITPTPTTFYAKLAEFVGQRYQRIFLPMDNVEPAWYGEIVSCQTKRLKCAMSPVQTVYTDHHVRIPRLMGGFATRALADWPIRTKVLTFQHADTPSTAESGYWTEWYGEFGLRPIGGTPCLIVPNEDRREVIYGHISPSISERDGEPGQAGFKQVDAVAIEEMALPVEL